MAATGPTPPALPPVPSGDYFNETQWTVLMAILDAVIPSIAAASTVTDEKTHRSVDDGEFKSATSLGQSKLVSPLSDAALKAYLEDRPSASPEFMDILRRTLSTIPPPARNKLGSVLHALS